MGNRQWGSFGVSQITGTGPAGQTSPLATTRPEQIKRSPQLGPNVSISSVLQRQKEASLRAVLGLLLVLVSPQDCILRWG